ncbi:MAG: DNA repair protein RadC [Solobacterium sp.]|nr:DNA repair protein RadC [Solobacterium sp.]
MHLVKDIPTFERPREKALRYGVDRLSSRELIALLLRCGVKGQSALDMADELLHKAGGLKGITRMPLSEMTKIKGLSKIKAIELFACFEIAMRIAYEEAIEGDVILTPNNLIHYLKLKLGPLQQENLLVVYLDNANHIIQIETLFIGTVNHSIASPREIFQYALQYQANKIVLVHNHPSGNLEPSEADILFTMKVIEAGKLLDIKMMDHLIITQNGYLSFMEEGMINNIP